MRIGPQADADLIPANPLRPQHIGNGADHAVNPHHSRVIHPNEMRQMKGTHQFAACQHQTRGHPAVSLRGQTKPGAFPDKRAADGHAFGQMQKVIIDHAPPGRWQKPHRPGMAAARPLPNHIKRVQSVIVILLPAFGIDLHIPAQPAVELVGAVAKHAVAQHGEHV